jgi:hypothetical protein
LQLSDSAIEHLVGLITGNSGDSQYRSGPQLVSFFNSFGGNDLYGQGFPSRHVFVREKLNELNGTEMMKDVVARAVIVSGDDKECESAAFQANRKIAPSGFKLAKHNEPGFWNDQVYIPGPIGFNVVPNAVVRISPSSIFLTEASLNEHLSKARDRLERGDFSGSISICYTLIEEFLKLRLNDLQTSYNDNEGDIKKLYRLYAKQAGLIVDGDTPDPLKPLLNGLVTLIGGFYEIANKAGDRHQKKFRPSAHHSKLVVSLTLSFCEFLLESKSSQD